MEDNEGKYWIKKIHSHRNDRAVCYEIETWNGLDDEFDTELTKLVLCHLKKKSIIEEICDANKKYMDTIYKMELMMMNLTNEPRYLPVIINNNGR